MEKEGNDKILKINYLRDDIATLSPLLAFTHKPEAATAIHVNNMLCVKLPDKAMTAIYKFFNFTVLQNVSL